MNANQLALRLAAQGTAVVEHLLPAGRKVAGEWKVGSTSGEAGQSLSVRLGGAKRGVWSDFATGQKGDLLDLWAAVRQTSISKAIVEAKAFLGICDSVASHQAKSFRRPTRADLREPTSRCVAWFTGRG